jgi:hypothetical protein
LDNGGREHNCTEFWKRARRRPVPVSYLLCLLFYSFYGCPTLT